MRIGIAVLLCVLLPLLGAPALGQAQSTVQVQGVLQSVDCENGTVTIDTGNGPNTVDVAPYGTVLVNSTSTPLCSLDEYTGTTISAWLVASGDTFEVARLEVVGQAPAAQRPAAPPEPTAPTAVAAPLPIDGAVMGTVAVGGLTYLLVHAPDGGYYRYPYYGAYYQYYYRPYYQPFVGIVPVITPVITVPAVIAGVVLGTVLVGGLAYILSRDAAGHYYRYPYYGPYRGYYGSRPEFRPYNGAPTNGSWNSAPVRQGDPRWNGTSQGPYQRPNSQPAPGYRGPTQPQPSQYQHGATQPAPGYHGPAQTQPSQYQHGATQPAPNYRGPTQPQPSQYQHSATQPTPNYRGPTQPQPSQYQRGATQPAPGYRGPTQPSQYQHGATQPAPGYRGPTQPQASQYQRGRTQQAPTSGSLFDVFRNLGTPAARASHGRGGDQRDCGRGSQGQSCSQGR